MVGKKDEISSQEVIQYLQELGLDPSQASRFTIEDIKKAYRKQAFSAHPDRGGDEETFIQINHAYHMLTDPSYRHRETRQKHPFMQDIEIKVSCSFEDAFFGRTINLAISRLVAKEIVDGNVNLERMEKEGKTEVETVTVSIDLPPGSNNGYVEKRQGQGLKVGDHTSNLIIYVMPDQRPGVQVKGQDIVMQIQIPLAIMIKGGKIDIVTMYGIKKAWVPPGSMPNTCIRIPNCGVDQKGDHYATLQPLFPDKKTLKDEEWQKLGINWEEHEKEIEAERQREKQEFEDFMKLKFGRNK